MKLCLRLVPFAVLAALLLTATSCERASAFQNQTIAISFAPDGSCQQSGSGGVASIIDVSKSHPVIYQGAATLSQFQVTFSSCPFASGQCPVNSPTGAAVNVGNPTGTVDMVYNYSNITINNMSCRIVGSMGVRVRP